MDFLNNELYIEHITKLYENYLSKFKSNKSRSMITEEINICEEILIEEFQDTSCCLHDCSEESSFKLPFEDQLFINKLPSPQDYLNNLIKEKIDYNFKNLSNYRVDRSYLNRILKGNLPSKNTLIGLGYFLKLNLYEMSELLNVYGFAFGNSIDDRVVYFAFSNNFNYNQFLEFIDLHGSNPLKKFFSK